MVYRTAPEAAASVSPNKLYSKPRTSLRLVRTHMTTLPDLTHGADPVDIS